MVPANAMPDPTTAMVARIASTAMRGFRINTALSVGGLVVPAANTDSCGRDHAGRPYTAPRLATLTAACHQCASPQPGTGIDRRRDTRLRMPRVAPLHTRDRGYWHS